MTPHCLAMTSSARTVVPRSQDEFDHGFGDVPVVWFVQQVVPGVGEFTHVDIAACPSPLSDRFDRRDPVVAAVYEKCRLVGDIDVQRRDILGCSAKDRRRK